MIDFGNRKDLLFLFIIGVLLVIAFVIFSLIMIWRPSNNENRFKVGDYDEVEISDDEIIKGYVEKISIFTKNEDYDGLYDLLSDDYIKYSKIKKESLKEKVEDLGINSQVLSIENYSQNKVPGYNKVFCTTVKGNISNKSARIIVKEVSPRQFKISFDDIILYDDYVNSQTTENIEFTFLNSVYKLSSASYKVSVTNHNKYSIYLNDTAKGDTFLLACGASDLKNQILANDRAKTTEVKPGETLSFNLSYKTNDIDISNIKGIVVKDVKYSNGNVANMQFNII